VTKHGGQVIGRVIAPVGFLPASQQAAAGVLVALADQLGPILQQVHAY
jgi:hypothetical protein